MDVWSHNAWLLFTKVNTAPISEITSGLWQLGWGGGEIMKETYEKQLASGTKFQTPITRKGRTDLESSQGHSINHIGFNVYNLDQTLERPKGDGVIVTDEPGAFFDGKLKYPFVEGPDHVRIEVLEDRTGTHRKEDREAKIDAPSERAKLNVRISVENLRNAFS